MTAPLLLTLERAAEALSVSPRTVRRLIDAGHLAPVRIGRSVRLSAVDLHAYVDRQIPRSNIAPGAVAQVQEEDRCHDNVNVIRMESIGARTRRTGGRRSRTDAADQLAALLGCSSQKTRND